MHKLRKLGFVGVSVFALLASGGIASAQEASSDEAQASSGDDIIVTARRRSERQQDVPLSIAAVSEETLKRSNIANVEEISRVAPSVTAQSASGGGRALPSFAIRGQAQAELTALSDPSVSIYSGDLLIGRPQGVNSILLDTASVEVLRGPQGTLFGRNTTGGAIVLRPNRPTQDLEGSASVTYGTFQMVNTEVMLNVPLGDNVALRGAFGSKSDDGYIFDTILGRNINRTSQQAFRASLLLTPGNVESLTVVNYFHENDGGIGASIVAFNSAGNVALNSAPARAGRNYEDLNVLFAEQQARGPFVIATGTPEYTKVKTFDVTNTTTIELSDSISIRNIAGYRNVVGSSFTDADGTSNSLFMIERFENGKQYSEEFHIIGESERLNWILGAFYFREDAENQGQAAVGTVDTVTPRLPEPVHVAGYPSAYTNTWVQAHNRSYAFFGQGTAKLADDLSLTLGARYTHDTKGATVLNRTATTCRYTRDLDSNPATPETNPGLAGCNLGLEAGFSAVTWNASLDYKMAPGKLIYLAHRKGYRSGGFGARAGTEATLRRTFKPETIYDVEVGFKGDWDLGSAFLRTNVAAYYGWYSNIQRLLSDNGVVPPQSVVTNAGKARIYGLEADVLFRPIPQVELTANYAHTNAKFVEFLGPDGVDRSIFPVARAPKNVYTLGLRVYPEMPAVGKVSLGASVYHTDKFSFGEEPYSPASYNGGYSIVNADISINNVMGSPVDLRFFATNLLNKVYYSNYSDNYAAGINAAGVQVQGNFGFVGAFPNRPRTFGVTAKVKFGG